MTLARSVGPTLEARLSTVTAKKPADSATVHVAIQTGNTLCGVVADRLPVAQEPADQEEAAGGWQSPSTDTDRNLPADPINISDVGHVLTVSTRNI